MQEILDNVVVVGDGPTGLQAALLLAKGGLGVHVLGTDASPTYKSVLRNVLGLPEVTGEAYMREARRQCESFGVHIHRQKATGLQRDGDGWRILTEEGNRFIAHYVVVATGRDQEFATSLGLEPDGDVIGADAHGRTSLHNVYAGGWLTRGHQIQVAISLGDGAAIALDILSKEKGKPFHDFDVLPAGGHAAAGHTMTRPAPGAQREDRTEKRRAD